MRFDGVHHITAITGNAQANVDFYCRVLGLRLVKMSVNQDHPTIYHLFYGDEHAHPGADLTFFEYPGAVKGVAGAGMVHRVIWKVASKDALAFWEKRLTKERISCDHRGHSLLFFDPEGLQHELAVVDDGNEPLRAEWHEVPAEHALLGFAGARAFSADPAASAQVLESTLNFEPVGDHEWKVAGDRRSSTFAFDTSALRGRIGAGAVHHIAWWAPDDEHPAWPVRLEQAGVGSTPVIDRHYFRSIYFTEPSGVLFELATESPGFTVDEPLAHLGERLSLPPKFEALRDELERTLAPLPNPRIPAL